MLLAFGGLLGAGSVQAAEASRRVLAIGPYAEALPFQAGFMSGLAEGLGKDVVLYREYLSYPAFSGEEHEANFERYLRGKYRQELDLLVLFGDGAIRWGQRYEGFHSEAKRLNLIESLQLGGEVPEGELSNYVVFPEQNFSEVLELIARVEGSGPIQVVYDEESSVSSHYRGTVERAATALGLGSRMVYLGGSFSEIRARLEGLPAGSPVVLLPYFKGAQGEPAIPAEGMPHLIEGLRLKFYTMWDTLMVDGVLGGKMMLSQRAGRMAAVQSLRLMGGEALLGEDVFGEGLYAYVFDDSLRRQFGIAASLLPEGSLLLNRKPRFFEEYYWQSLFVVFAFLGLLASIVSLRLMVRRKTRELRLRNQELNTTLRQKNKLSELGRSMTMLAHDLRSPICTIKTCSDLMADTSNLPVDRGWLAESMGEASRKCLSMISDMLDYVRTLEPKIETLPAEEFIASLEGEIARSVAAFQGVPVQCRLLGRGDVSLDAMKVSRVVVNLVKNALEALDQAKVEDPRVLVEVEVGESETAISVSDNGPGVGKEIAERLFEPFKTEGKSAGTGLGLAIAKEFVEAHGGEIFCDTEFGETVFRIRLPNKRSRVDRVALENQDSVR
ncbi:HAMP domain-containing sensor histidine kinase [Pelagicoccus sp. SDUM812005]|uniref:HAMP domain-containing sensor histidine kinase n=1 Tax=Pelagicoccus sp. SDUM812005 TaxID=3041257 RepID=UPI0028122C27|nr:HAMP domain-containing sensor histidine kinase [Pelagicoccus sp. SDUM812005]